MVQAESRRRVAYAMKVLIVNDYSTPSGGAENYALRLRDGLRAQGHEVRFLSSDAARLGLPPQAEYAFHRRHVLGRAGDIVGSAVSSAGPAALRRCLREFRPDLVHLHLFTNELSVAALAELAETAAVATVHDYAMFCPVMTRFVIADLRICNERCGPACVRQGCITRLGGLLHGLRKRLLDRYAGNVDLWIAPSRFTLALLADHGLSNSARLPYGIDLDEFPCLGWPREQGVLFASRLDLAKGGQTLVEAWPAIRAACPRAHLWVAGRGGQRPALEALVTQLGVDSSVSFLGWQEAAQVRALHERCSVQVVPSIWADNYPVAICEAFALGTPVVGTSVGGIPDLVAGATPELLVPPQDPGALAAAVISLLADEAYARRASGAVRAFAEKTLEMEQHVRALTEHYGALLEPRGGGIGAEAPRA